MESATVLKPHSTGLMVFCFPSEPNIPEGPEYEKISTLYVVLIFSALNIDYLEFIWYQAF